MSPPMAGDGDDPPDPAFAALLRRRAERLAAPRADGTAPEGLPVLTFRLGTELYGLPLAALSEVTHHLRCAAVPGWAPELLGVANRRGALLPILDLRRLLGLSGDGGPGVFLFLRGPREVGLRADGLGEIRRVPDAERIGAPPGTAGPLVAGIATDGLILLDPRRILGHPLFGPGAEPLPDNRTDRTR